MNFKRAIVSLLLLSSSALASSTTSKQLDTLTNSIGGSPLSVPSVGSVFSTDTNTLTFTNKTWHGVLIDTSYLSQAVQNVVTYWLSPVLGVNNAPPVSAVMGTRYLVLSNPVGVWSSNPNSIATAVPATYSQQPFTSTSNAGVSIVSGTVTRTASFTNSYDAGAVGNQFLDGAFNGEVDWTVSNLGGIGVGLTNTPQSGSDYFSNADFFLNDDSSGNLYVYHNGTCEVGACPIPSVTITTSDALAVAWNGTNIVYKKNGSVVWTDPNTPTFPLNAQVGVFFTGYAAQSVTVTQPASIMWTFVSAIEGQTVNSEADGPFVFHSGTWQYASKYWSQPALSAGNTPPSMPSGGDLQVVLGAGTGAWSGHNNSIARWDTGSPSSGPVTWTNFNNTSAVGGTLTFNTGSFSNNSATTTQSLSNNGEELSFSVNNAATNIIVGLTHVPFSSGNGPAQTDFIMNFSTGGPIYKANNDTNYVQIAASWSLTDTFEIKIVGGAVEYYQNGTLLSTDSNIPTFPLYGVGTASLSGTASITVNAITLGSGSWSFTTPTEGQTIFAEDTGIYSFHSGTWNISIGSGANQTLSNLTSPTAINQALIFASGNLLQTQDQAAATASNLTIRGGNSTSNASGLFGGTLVLSSGYNHWNGGGINGPASITLEGGGSDNFGGGDVDIVAGVDANGNQAGRVNITGGAGGGGIAGGNITLTPGAGSSPSAAGIISLSGQFASTFGTPTVPSCGTSPSISGSNQAGLLAIGSGALTACTVSFSVTLGQAPNACILFPANSTAAATGTTGAYVSSISTSQFVITGLNLTSANYYYLCI